MICLLVVPAVSARASGALAAPHACAAVFAARGGRAAFEGPFPASLVEVPLRQKGDWRTTPDGRFGLRRDRDGSAAHDNLSGEDFFPQRFVRGREASSYALVAGARLFVGYEGFATAQRGHFEIVDLAGRRVVYSTLRRLALDGPLPRLVAGSDEAPPADRRLETLRDQLNNDYLEIRRSPAVVSARLFDEGRRRMVTLFGDGHLEVFDLGALRLVGRRDLGPQLGLSAGEWLAPGGVSLESVSASEAALLVVVDGEHFSFGRSGGGRSLARREVLLAVDLGGGPAQVLGRASQGTDRAVARWGTSNILGDVNVPTVAQALRTAPELRSAADGSSLVVVRWPGTARPGVGEPMDAAELYRAAPAP